MKTIIALHKHWYTADALKVVVCDDVIKIDLEDGLFTFEALGDLHAAFLRISTWYSLLYVVVDCWIDLRMKDDEIDFLLSNKKMVEGLRQFHHAISHYQGDPMDSELMTFLEQEESEVWVRKTHQAFKNYIEKHLPIEEMFAFVLRK
ncbi:hypothetical protein [Candidatus Pantoea bituminis]|uniref:hypothetical protein n=1 Tax=Candidatus Pantoea bituminis TaxID=2831036 RepID=UPI001C06381A|nr:hypothetical protein [Pantoea bituminis]